MSALKSQLDNNAQKGFTNASSYDVYRPSYPLESVDNLLKQLKVQGVKGARIVEIAAGTGKFTQLLAAREEKYEIIAVEPHAEMRAELKRNVTEKGWTNVKVEEGFADSMGKVADQWADAVVVAQGTSGDPETAEDLAFHWFSNMTALQEIHRVMAPGTALGLVWNIEDYNSRPNDPLTTDYERIIRDDINKRYDDNTKAFRHFKWPAVFDEQLKSDPVSIHTANPLFSLPLGEHVAEWTVWLSKEGVWSRFYTISHIAYLTGKDLEDAKKSVHDALETAPTNDKGEVAIHGKTYSYWTTAIPGETLNSGG